MARKILDEELEHLNSQVLQMGSQVQRTLERTLEALITANQEIAGDIVNGDNVIDDLHLLIEEDAYRILSLQQPLYSHDLRFLTAVVPIALDLERIGDEAETCAQNLLRLLPLHFTDIMSILHEQSQDEVDGTQLSEIAVLHHILELGDQVQVLFQQTMQALSERGVEKAHQLWEGDILINRGYYRIHRDMATILGQKQAASDASDEQYNPTQVLRAVALLWIAHAFMRMAAHCANICERIVFIVEGETDMQPDMDE